MNKSSDHDLPLKLRLRRILFKLGYWAPIEVELSHYDYLGTSISLKRKSLTDLDVLGIKYDPAFTPHKVVGDCKLGRNVSDVNRLFWLRGVMDFFGANQAYFLHPAIDSHARAIAPKMGIRVLDDKELTRFEEATDAASLQLPLADVTTQQRINDLWGIEPPPRGQSPTEDQLALKNVYSYLSYSYWYIEKYRNLLVLVRHFEDVARYLDPANPRHVLMAHTGAERFALTLLDLADHVLAQGATDVPQLARTYLYGGPLGIKDKERFFTILRNATKSSEQLDPSWLPEAIELVGRMIRHPHGASDVLRHLEASYLWCCLQSNVGLPRLDPAIDNTAAVSMAKDVAITFSAVTGIPRDLFSWLNFV
jgi:hypothetical protein